MATFVSDDKLQSLEKGVNGYGTLNGINPSSKQPALTRLANYIAEEATFFRIHLSAFTFIPLIFSGIFYASNGRFRISYLDSLFLCYSAMTVTGLSTVNLSTLTVWQQVILYFLMMIGDITIVSWTMVLVRKRYFRTHCEYIVASSKKKPLGPRSRNSIFGLISSPREVYLSRKPADRQEKKNDDDFINPEFQFVGPTPGPTPGGTLSDVPENQPLDIHDMSEDDHHILSETQDLTSSPEAVSIALPLDESPQPKHRPPKIEFAMSTTVSPRIGIYNRMMTIREDGVAVPRRGTTMLTNNRYPDVPGSPGGRSQKKYQGLGGFPSVVDLVGQSIKIVAPNTYRRVQRKMTMPTVTTLDETKTPWLNISGLVVGRNSDFHTETLTDEELEDVGGAEYRALRLLSYLVPAYFVVTQLIALLLFLPWLSGNKSYDGVFEAQPRLVGKPWFSLFQVMGAYTGGGLSLVDLGMVPFQNAYLMIVAMMFVILAGNHALPIFLRLTIWVSSQIVPATSSSYGALSFLLDHPRRCFLYLFPSHQTWFLVICLVLFSAIEWVASLVLNIGIPAYESIPKGPRVISGLFQGLAARASGFSIVPIASFAPALQFLYVVMMYIAIYPVALSIRSTNVYEERSLGVFEAPPDDEDEEPDEILKAKTRRERVGRYLGWHLRRQMSVDIWWLVWAVFIVAIIERKNLLDDSKKWFDLFRVLFELVSAFGGIGLSLGFPTDNFSFVGAMSPLSKLVVIVIMVRGRHRGLPVAVDRAVLLPVDLAKRQQAQTQNAQTREPVAEQLA
ncbi:potassium transporter [Crassisporium funariophilum]|nr:potassium transporter [Crassisporium funariophilum]